MKISANAQYGLRAMAYLAQNHASMRAIPAKEVSSSEKIPADYLEKIITKLEKAGLVVSKKGMRGGYSLGRPSGQIKISEIFNALEKPATKVKCIDAKCSQEGTCLTKNLWCKMQSAVNNFLESVTLEDIIKDKI